MEVFEINGDILMSCRSKEEVICIPEGVRIINMGALKGCKWVKEVVLPMSVERIEEQALKGCRQLEKINFPERLYHIGAYAFHRCHHLKEIRLPFGISKLPDCAFLYCDGLEFAELPSVKVMGKHAFVNAINLKKLSISSELSPECINDTFTGCTKISEIVVDGYSFQIDNLISAMERKQELPRIVSAIIGDIYHTMDMEASVLTEFRVEVKEVKVPEGIVEIGKSCFFDKRGIWEIHLPKSLKKIGKKAFRNCINLEHIVFQNEEVEISEAAFQNCTNLKKITLAGKTYFLTGLPEDEKNRQMPNMIYTIYTQVLGNFCISGTVLLRYWGKEERVTVPEGITVIGERAFAGNEAIGKMILPESVVEIQKEAFADCLLLQTLNFPKGLKKIGTAVFEGCVKLLRAEIPKNITKLSPSVFSRCKKLKQILWEETTLQEIGQQAFYGCHNLSSFIFPESLKKIDTLAFYQCHSLKTVVLPKNVSYVGAEAFACCNGIKEITIEGAVMGWGKNIVAYAKRLQKVVFHGEKTMIPEFFAWKCTELSQVIIPKTIKNIGLSAFYNTPFFMKLPNPKTLGTVFLDGKNMEKTVKIPEGITAIAGGAFYGNEKITSVILPESLEFLGERAFCNCTSLKEIQLPKKITVISNGAFAYCIGLKQITWEGEIKEIGEKAFYQCSSLEEISILSHVSIGDYAFYGCKKWKKSSIYHCTVGAYTFGETKLLRDCLKENKIAVIDKIAVDLSQSEKVLTLPTGISSIACYACYGNKNITKLILPEGLKEIGAFAFCGCTELLEVFIPDSVKRIAASAFEKCTKIQTVSSAAQFLGQRAFAFCKNLRLAIFPYLSEFSQEAFFGCQNLQIIKAEQVGKVNQRCFKGCEKLQYLPSDEIKEIEEEAFANCEGLKSISFPSKVRIAAKAFLDCCGLISLSFKDSFAIFDDTAFSGSTFVERVQVEKEEYFLSGYEDLFQEKLPEFVKRIYISLIGCFYFQNTKTIAAYRNNAKAVRIPEGIHIINGGVFKDCIQLEQVEIPKSVTYIGERAFFGTSWLKKKAEKNPFVIVNHILLDGTSAFGEVVIPKEVHIISGWAFANCYGLRKLVLLNQNLIIEIHAFRNCIYLEQVIAADGKNYIMKGLSVRKDLSLPPNIMQIFEDVLNCYKTDKENILIECTGNIPCFALAHGITAIGKGVFRESNLLTYAILTEEVEWIGESAFAFCKWLTQISHAENVREIKAMAFLGCVRLESMEFSQCLKVIGKRAFENCVSLHEVILPEGLKEIPRRAFFRCRSLERLILPASLERIGEEAFAFCSSLQEVILPKGLLEIGNRGFAWCKKLKSIQIPELTKLGERVFEFSYIEREKQKGTLW